MRSEATDDDEVKQVARLSIDQARLQVYGVEEAEIVARLQRAGARITERSQSGERVDLSLVLPSNLNLEKTMHLEIGELEGEPVYVRDVATIELE